MRRLESFGEITSIDAASAVQRLEMELARFQITEVSTQVLAVARNVVDTSQLRALDALQLATALLVTQAAQTSALVLVASDKKLLEAAQASGLTTLNPEHL